MATTPEIVEKWRRKNLQGFFEIEFEGKKGYYRRLHKWEFKKLSIKTLMTKSALEFAHEILRKMWVGGDHEFKHDEEFKIVSLNKLADEIEKDMRIYFPNVSNSIK